MGLPLPADSVIDRLALPFGVSVERRDGSTVDATGDAVRGVVTNFVMPPRSVVIHPASGRDLIRLLEGDRSKEAIRVYSKTVLRTAREASGQEADVLLFPQPTPTAGGILHGRYTIMVAQDWQHTGKYTKSIAVKQESDTP
jgi:hypothetical protein